MIDDQKQGQIPLPPLFQGGTALKSRLLREVHNQEKFFIYLTMESCMKFITKAVATLTLSTLSTLAMAGISGGYVDIGLGFASQECEYCGTDIDLGFGGKIAGGYRINDYVALEVGFAGGQGAWSDSGSTDAEESTNTIFGAVVGIYPFTTEFEVFGRLGLGNSKTVTTIGDYEFKSNSASGAVLGLGAGYTPLGTKLTWRVEYNHLSSDKSTDYDSSGTVGPDGLGLFSLGVVVGF